MVRHERVWPAGFKDAAEVRNSSELVPPSPPPTQEQTTTLTTVSSNHLEMRRRVSSATDLAPLTTQPLAPQLFSLYISDTNHCIKALEPRGTRPWWISGFLCTHTKCIGSAFSELIKCTAMHWFLLFTSFLQCFLRPMLSKYLNI